MTPYYSDEQITLYHGDALAVLPDLRAAGCMILDPPYHMAPSTFRGKDDGAASSIATPVRLLTETFRHTYRLLPDGGAAFIFCDWRRGPDTTYLATLAGLRISTCLAWTRNRSGTGGMFRGSWDPIYVASKGTPAIRDRGAIPNVVNADHPTDREHPYEKPAKVWQHLLSRIPETTVVDAFAGSCTSADAAVRNGHRWVGIEADERHCEAAVRRWGQHALFGGAEPFGVQIGRRGIEDMDGRLDAEGSACRCDCAYVGAQMAGTPTRCERCRGLVDEVARVRMEAVYAESLRELEEWAAASPPEATP